MSKEVWDKVRADVDAGWEALSLDQRHQFTELVKIGGDASALGQLVADALKETPTQEVLENEVETPTPTPVKRKRK